MKNFDQFHDGSLDGLLIGTDSVQVLLSSDAKEHFVLIATGVAALTANGFKTGNIILDVLMKQEGEITAQDIKDVYELPTSDVENDKAGQLLQNAIERNLIFVEINPSYGANCLVLAKSIELLQRKT